ncbi:MAG: glycosyl transferase [Cyclobacteriaceae bacterium]
MSDKKVLIITYYWPPSGGVGVQRWLHFAINLKKMGIEPVIYTPSNPQFEIQDEELLKLASDIEVIKKPIWEPFQLFHKLTGSKNKGKIQQGVVLEKPKKSFKDKLFVWMRGNLFVPDARRYWVKPSVKFLSAYLVDKSIDTIITTGPPHTMHMIGLGLKKSRPMLNWIADFRDPWSDWDILKQLKTGPLAMSWHRRLEKNVLKKATRVITVSKRLGLSLEAKIAKEKEVKVLMNGIDLEDKSISVRPNSKKFTIGYFGMLNELRDPQELWLALERICAENKDFASKLEIRIGGIVSDSIVDRIKSSEYLSPSLNLLGYVPHQEVFRHYQECDVLLLLLNKSDNAKWILPVKFFEYLSAQRPILTFGPDDSDLGDILRENNIGEMMSGEDSNEIAKFILANFTSQYSTEKKDFDQLLASHSRVAHARELADLINSI